MRYCLKSVTSECTSNKRISQQFLRQLHERFEQAGLHTNPTQVDEALRPGDWVRFSTEPFPPDLLSFAKEKDLQRFVKACLGNRVFRGLEIYKDRIRVEGHEFCLDDGERIDLLCQERTRTGFEALVAIELKRGGGRGSVEQMLGYLKALRKQFPTRDVRGIIVSGQEDPATAALLKDLSGYRIELLCYQVTFKKL